MAQQNQKYITAETILSMLSSYIKKKEVDINDIIEWCAECEITVLGDVEQMHKYFMIPITVTNYKALLPCNVYRLLDVFDCGDNRINHYNDGSHLVFNPKSLSILFTLYSIPGLLLIGIPKSFATNS